MSGAIFGDRGNGFCHNVHPSEETGYRRKLNGTFAYLELPGIQNGTFALARYALDDI
jgi:hypothetical protein